MYKSFSHRLQFRTVAPQYQRSAKQWPQMATKKQISARQKYCAKINQRFDVAAIVVTVFAGLSFGLIIGASI